MKQREAKYVNTAPYGYVVDPADKHHLIIEPNTGVVVRRIFMDVLSGKSCTQIAKELNAENIPTPAQAKATVRKTARPKSQWTHRMLLNILANIKYTGTMVNHTRESQFIRDKNQRRLPPEEWFVRENAHEAIVTRDEYQQAQEAIPHQKNPSGYCMTSLIGCTFVGTAAENWKRLMVRYLPVPRIATIKKVCALKCDGEKRIWNPSSLKR